MCLDSLLLISMQREILLVIMTVTIWTVMKYVLVSYCGTALHFHFNKPLVEKKKWKAQLWALAILSLALIFRFFACNGMLQFGISRDLRMKSLCCCLVPDFMYCSSKIKSIRRCKKLGQVDNRFGFYLQSDHVTKAKLPGCSNVAIILYLKYFQILKKRTKSLIKGGPVMLLKDIFKMLVFLE